MSNCPQEKSSLKKISFYEELAYLIGLILIALSVTLMTKAGFGVSMVVAPAYVIFLKLSPLLPFLTFGMTEYLFQFLLLVVMMLVIRRFRASYLFSFATAVIYGTILDLCNLSLNVFTPVSMSARILTFAVATLVCCIGVSLMFHTYIAPEVYELFVKEVAKRFHLSMSRFKWIYDATSLLIAYLLSGIFFGFLSFTGLGIGTLICAMINGPIIGLISRFLDRFFLFKPAFPRIKHFFMSEKEGKT